MDTLGIHLDHPMGLPRCTLGTPNAHPRYTIGVHWVHPMGCPRVNLCTPWEHIRAALWCTL